MALNEQAMFNGEMVKINKSFLLLKERTFSSLENLAVQPWFASQPF